MFSNHLFDNHLVKACLVAVFAIGLTACSSSDSGGSAMPDPTPEPDPAMACTDGGGEWNADTEMCTSAADLAAARAETQRVAITNAATMAQTAVAGVNDESTDSEVAAADAAVKAVKDAIAAADDLSEDDAAIVHAQGVLSAIEPQLAAAKTSRTAAMGAAAQATMKANAKTGKDLHAALGPPDVAVTPQNALSNAAVTLSAAGLAVDAAAGAGALTDTTGGATATDPVSVTLKAGASAGSLDGWAGTNYAHTDTDTKVVNQAVVYTNKGSADSMSFVEKYGDETAYTASTRTYDTGDGSAADAKVKAAAFPTAGLTTFTGAQDLPGTYDGAPGRYKCAATATCTAAFSDDGITLSDGWTFVHASGARVSTPDAHYLFYGWWVSKDKDGMPTAASAFTGRFGTDTNDSTDGLDPVDLTAATLTGSATYVGHAAGKFAMSNPLDGTGNGGHFTADAMLTANFGTIAETNDNGVTGTIDNFRLNDGSEDPGWSVELNNSSAWTNSGGITGPTSEATVWSINDNKAPASGAWSGMMYDEMPGNAPDGDGSNIPTTVTGTFYSEFSTIGRMVGAFGADKE